MTRPVSALAPMSEHKISYTGKLGGSKHEGYKWYCTCGASSGSVPWAERWERTWDAHLHLSRAHGIARRMG